jgi:hypothetical protein
MRARIIVRSFEQVLQILRDNAFDVGTLPGVAGKVAVSKYGAAAILAPNPKYSAKTAADGEHPVIWIHPPGWILRGKLSRLVDHGHQKLFETPTAQVAATAGALKSVHRFSEELREAIGEPSLYNESLGTVSDLYLYDRLKGREPEAPPSAGNNH